MSAPSTYNGVNLRLTFIDGDACLLDVLRYIHRNPVRTNMVERPADYEWNGNRGYVASAKKRHLLYKCFALSIPNEGAKSWRRVYNQLMSDSDSEEIGEAYAKK